MGVVDAEELTKDYAALRAVDHISFEIRTGECFGLLGPNGAGKTTLMRMVHCVLPVTSGSLRVFGLDASRSASEIKARIGVMPQDDSLDPDLTVMENLTVYARYFDIPARQSRPRARDLLAFVELSNKAEVNVKSLSGGMKRRLLLARALMNAPDLLVLDEPTTGLDPHSRRTVWERMESLKAEGTTLVLSTHSMEEAEVLCDRVAIMDGGMIVAVDTPRDLLLQHGGNLEHVYLKLTGKPLAD